MSVMDAYLGAAEQAVTLLEAPEVAAAWEQPSALPEMTVGGLAGHLAHQIFSVSAAVQLCVDPALRESRSPAAPIALLEHYARATWIDEPPGGEVNAGIRAKGEGIAAQGAAWLVELARTAFAEQHKLARCPGDQAVFIPQTGWELRLDDFLVTRLLEIAVHMDDLAVSVHLPAPELSEAAFDPVLVLLARLAARRHGQAALLRALTRVERAPAAVNAI